MAISERNINSDARSLPQLYKMEETERNTHNLKRPFEFQVPRKVLEERVKSWDNFFEKYSMEATDAMELNLKTLNPDADPLNEYEPELRIPMRNPLASIQYWVDTGKPPCKAYVEENYSDSGSSLSESELSVPRPAPSPPLKYSLPHPPQPANIPHEKLERVSSVISSSSVNTREYIMSATQLTSKKLSLATMESVIDSKKSAEALFNIEDTYVDVCGTDELPKILEEETYMRAASSMSNCQINELERPFIVSEMFEKNLPDESAIIGVTTASLKIGDIIPSLQQIRDGPENYNCNDLYSDHLPSNISENLIECKNINSTTSSLKIEKPVIKVREFGRRKLFTNSHSPTELIPSSSQSSRRFSANKNLHPALAKYEMLQNKSKRKRKLFLQPKKKLQDIVKDKGKVNKNKMRETANNEKNKEIKEKQDQKNDSNLKVKEKINEAKDDQRLKQIPIVKVERLSESFIQSYRHKSDKKKSKSTSFKAKYNKKDRKIDKETKVACISAAVNNEFVNKRELKIRDLIVSLERLPRVVLERLPQKIKSEESSIEKTLTKGTSTIESSVVPECFIRIFEPGENETQNQKFSKKSNSAKKSFTRKSISFSSDEEDMDDIFEVNKEKFLNPKSLLKKGSSENAKEKHNFFTSSVKIDTNLTLKSNTKEQNSCLQFNSKSTNFSAKSNNKNQTLTQFNNIKQTSPIDINNKSENSYAFKNTTQNSFHKSNKKDQTRKVETSPLKFNTETEISRKSIKKSISFSSDEDDDFTIFMAHVHSPKESINNRKFSRTWSDLSESNDTVLNEIVTLNNLSVHLKTERSKGCDHNLTETSSRDQKRDKENNDVNSEQITLNDGRLLRLEIVSSEDSSDSDSKVTFSRNKRKNLKRKSSETRITNPRRYSKKNIQKTTKIANEKLALETLEEENSHSSMNSRILFKTQSLQNFTKKKEKINNLSTKLETKTSKGSDNNLEDMSNRDDKENKDANYEQTTFNSFRNVDNGRLLRLEIVSSEDSSDSDNKVTLSRNKRKNLKRKSFETRITKPRRSSKNNLENSTKIANEKPALETLEEKNSHSSVNSRILFKAQSESSIEPVKKDLENERINERDKADIIQTKKSLVFQKDSDSDSSLDIFDSISIQKKETKDKISSEIQTPPKKLQNNDFHKENVQISKKIKSPLQQSSMFNKKRKKSGFSGLISSDSEQNQSDHKFIDHQTKSIGTFQNEENVIKILPPKRLRKEVEEMSQDSSISTFGDNQSRNSSLNIFGSSNESSEDESTFLYNFNNRLRNRKSNLNFAKEFNSGVKLQMFRTKSFSESDTD